MNICCQKYTDKSFWTGSGHHLKRIRYKYCPECGSRLPVGILKWRRYTPLGTSLAPFEEKCISTERNRKILDYCKKRGWSLIKSVYVGEDWDLHFSKEALQKIIEAQVLGTDC